MFRGVAEVVYFVSHREDATQWYASLFAVPVTRDEGSGFSFLQVGSQRVWFHDADTKVPAGGAGQVAYFQVDQLEPAVERAKKFGAQIYRGPLKRLDGRMMCQLKDPFGNLIGLIGGE